MWEIVVLPLESMVCPLHESSIPKRDEERERIVKRKATVIRDTEWLISKTWLNRLQVFIMKNKLLKGKHMTQSYQIKSSREGRQGKVIHPFLHFCYMLPSEKTGWKVQNRQGNFLPWSQAKLWQPLPQGIVGTETRPRFKSNKRNT